MPDLIEPNIHPVFVHFTYALLVTSALSLFVVAISSPGGWRDTLRHAGDWMLAFGIIAAIATIAAGFQAYYSVNHDGPSHAAMITHRNWALPTAGVLTLLALWRFMKRAEKPGTLYALLLLGAAGMLSVTAWWGGRLVYVHGLGVQSMPQAIGEGHDHEHAPGEEHDDAPASTPAEEHSHEAGEGLDESPESATPSSDSSAEYPATPEGVVDAFGAALKSGNAAMLERILLPDVLIAEGGGAERSFAEYAGHHMPADMAFTKAVESALKDRKVIESADMATIVSTSQSHGEFQGKTIHSQMMETMVLKQVNGEWRIAHIHWSSAPLKEDHEH